MQNYTQGEWKMDEIISGTVPRESDPLGGAGWNYKSCSIKNSNGDILADVKGYSTDMFVNPDAVEANAKLIATAPDLLQIAKQVVFMLDNYPKGSMGKELAESAQSAINKATK